MSHGRGRGSVPQPSLGRLGTNRCTCCKKEAGVSAPKTQKFSKAPHGNGWYVWRGPEVLSPAEPVVTAMLGNGKLEFLIDTGAGYLVLNTLQGKLSDDSITTISATGTESVPGISREWSSLGTGLSTVGSPRDQGLNVCCEPGELCSPRDTAGTGNGVWALIALSLRDLPQEDAGQPQGHEAALEQGRHL